MSTATKTIFDVFLSHGPNDVGLAAVVTNALASEGLEVYAVDAFHPGDSFLDAMRERLAECSAVIILLTRSTLQSSNVAFEVGLALAWDKPVYVLYDGISEPEIPDYLRQFDVAQVSQLDQVVEDILATRQPLSDSDRATLADVYRELGIHSEQLLWRPSALHELSIRFKNRTRRAIPAEKLAQELIRLRKQGKLPRIKNN